VPENKYDRVSAARPGARERARFYHGLATSGMATKHKRDRSLFNVTGTLFGMSSHGLSASAEVYVDCRKRYVSFLCR
jgi:hypothetical protein